MKLSAIKKLVDSASIEDLLLAERALRNLQNPSLEVDGEDEGEQLTHVLAARFIQIQMSENGLDYVAALRLFLTKVRTSVSLT